MKSLLLLFLLLPVFLSAQDSIVWKLDWAINSENSVWNIDTFGNLIVSDGDKMQKFDSLGTAVFSQSNKNWGNISSIDPSNPMKILIFSEDQQLISYVDNTLSKQQELIDLNEHNLSYVTLVTTSGQPDKFWVYDQDNSKIVLIARNILQQQRIENIRGLLGCKQVKQIVEKDNNLYLIDEEQGILKFDLYGTFISKWEMKGVNFVHIENELAYFIRENKLNVLELQTEKTHLYKLPLAAVLKVKKESNSLYVETPSQILKYSIQILK
jgi:hypothetical protein